MIKKFKLKVDLQYPDWFKKGMKFYFNEDTAIVYGEDDGKMSEYPLRNPLAGYLYLLRLESNKFFKEEE